MAFDEVAHRIPGCAYEEVPRRVSCEWSDLCSEPRPCCAEGHGRIRTAYGPLIGNKQWKLTARCSGLGMLRNCELFTRSDIPRFFGVSLGKALVLSPGTYRQHRRLTAPSPDSQRPAVSLRPAKMLESSRQRRPSGSFPSRQSTSFEHSDTPTDHHPNPNPNATRGCSDPPSSSTSDPPSVIVGMLIAPPAAPQSSRQPRRDVDR